VVRTKVAPCSKHLACLVDPFASLGQRDIRISTQRQDLLFAKYPVLATPQL